MRLTRADVHRIHYDESIVNDSWHEMKKLEWLAYHPHHPDLRGPLLLAYVLTRLDSRCMQQSQPMYCLHVCTYL